MKVMDIIFFYFALINQGRAIDTSMVESGSDIDDPCSSLGRRSSALPALAAVDEEVSYKLPILYLCGSILLCMYHICVGLFSD